MDQVRITVMLNSKLQSKLRDLQARRIKETNKSTSFSQILNEVLADTLKVKLD